MFNTNKQDDQQVDATNQDIGKDPALLAAWRRFLDYDGVSTYQKNTYVRLRIWVIRLGFIITTLSVLSNFQPKSTLGNGVLRFTLILLPLGSAAVLQYAQRFTSPIWIDYRVSAEKIRSAVYLYRMQADEYKDKTNQERQELLLGAIDTEKKAIENQPMLVPYLQSTEKPVVSRLQRVLVKDDGFSPLSLNQYVDIRVLMQRNWYISRINKDQQQVRGSFRTAQITAILSGILSGIGLEPFVAITAALGVAINMNADLGLYGATYAIFHSTAVSLDDRLNKWAIIADDGEPSDDQKATFVADVEAILGNERDKWLVQAKQLQRLVERSLTGTESDKQGE